MTGWHPFKLEDLCSKITDGSHNPPKGVDFSEFMMLSSKNVFDDYIHFDKPRYLLEADFVKENRRTDVSAGDVLLTIVGTVGRVAVVDGTLPKFTLQRSVAVLKPNLEKVIPRFLMYSLQGMLEEMLGQSRGVAQKGIYLKSLRAVEIGVPPISEQKRIVAILDQAFADIDRAREHTERNILNARELFESYLQQVFSQHGEGWSYIPLGQICRFVSGGTPSKKNGAYWDGDIPWISGRDMKDTQLSDSFLHISQGAVEDSAAKLAPIGSILILVRGMGLAHGAQVAELLKPCAFNQDIKAAIPDSRLISRFLVFALKYQMNTSEHVFSNAAHGTMKIDMEQLANILVPVPPLDQQHHLVSIFNSLIGETKHLDSLYSKKLESLEAIKKSLLQKAFDGELSSNETDAA